VRIAAIEGGVRFQLLVVPGASRTQIVGEHGGALRIRVAAPPEKGKANAAVCSILAAVLAVKRSDVRIVAGHGNRNKSVTVIGLNAESVRALLGL